MTARVDVLDHGYLELVESWGSDQSIIEGARMSTGKGFLGWGEPKDHNACRKCGVIRVHAYPFDGGPRYDLPPNPPGNNAAVACEVSGGHDFEEKPGDEKLLRYLWENKHSTPFELAGATFEVQAPIFVFREWHRHRVPFGYSEASARYAPLPDLNYIPTVERLMAGTAGSNKQAGTLKDAEALTLNSAETWRGVLSDMYFQAESFYQSALKMGIPKELARVILPAGRYSKMRATGNLRGWLSFLTLRNAPTAQEEIRVYAKALQSLLKEKFPRTLALFEEGRSK